MFVLKNGKCDLIAGISTSISAPKPHCDSPVG